MLYRCQLHSACATALLATLVPSAAADTTLDERLERLVDRLEVQRVALHIPGMAIAVVKDDEVILARGFGLADLEAKRPVTPETLFAIGSSTKAFTATAIGMLVDEGRMGWDDPVTDHLPFFTLDIDAGEVGQEVTIRDLLSHRTGFTRMGILWAGGTVPREEVLEIAVGAEPWSPFRAEFHYNNVMFLAAGVAAGKVAGDGWDALIAERILEPLGMDSSNSSVRLSQKDPRLALGYQWDEETESFDQLPMRVLDTIAPAGAINSNVLDMSRWVRFQLGHGTFEGTRLISEAALEETRTPQMMIQDGVDYGLGWMLHDWDGQPVVQHGGNIDGFASALVLYPESNLGFSLLANVTATSLQQASIAIVGETILGYEPPGGAGGDEAEGDTAGESFEPYLGEYLADFGSLQDTTLTVLEQNGRLALDVPGQMVFELNPPDEEGRRTFAVADQIAISFEHDENGDVLSLLLYQGGMTFEAPREGAVFPVEIDLDELQEYLGKYRSENLGTEVEVVIQNNRLAVDVPEQMVFELHVPDDEGRWTARAISVITVGFDRDESGRIESVTMYRDGEVEETMPRVAKGPPLPTLEEILALRDTDRRRDALASMGTWRSTGRVYMLHSGARGTFTTWANGPDRVRADIDFGRLGHTSAAVDGDRGWTDSTFRPFDELNGRYLDQARLQHPAAFEGDLSETFDTIRVLRAQALDDREVYVLRAERGDLPPATLYVDAEHGDVVRVEQTMLAPGIGRLPMEIRFEDFREHAGIRMAFRRITRSEWDGETVIEVEKIEDNVEAEEDLFRLEESK